VMAPHVLRYVLETVDGFESKFAAAIGADLADVSSPIDEIVAHVAAVRDSLDVPQQASELPGADPDDIPALAEFVLDDWMMPQAPTELDPTQAEIEAILEEAW